MKLLQLVFLGLTVGIIAAQTEKEEIERTHEWMVPKGCIRKKTCVYWMSYKFDSTRNFITFNIEAKQSEDTYTGIGFTDSKTLDKTDYIVGHMTKNGEGLTYNGYLEDLNSKPEQDTVNNLVDASIICKDEYLIMHFSRDRKCYNERDADLTCSSCKYMVFPVEGGPIEPNYIDVGLPYTPLTVTEEKICFDDCLTTTPEPTTLESSTLLPHNIDEPATTPEMETTIAPEVVTCEGREDGSYAYPRNCTMYFKCLDNGYPDVFSCTAGNYWDPVKTKCCIPKDLTDVRRKECGLV